MNRKQKDVGQIVRFWVTCFAIAAFFTYLFTYPAFRIRSVVVEGADTVAPATVIAAARVPMGANIWLTLLSHRILRNVQRDPEIATVTAGPILPHTIDIRVSERQPFTIFAAAGHHWLMDKDGIPYRAVNEAEIDPSLPVLAYTGPLPVGEPVLGKSMTEVWLTKAFQLVALLRQSNNLGVQKITVDQSANLCLNDKNLQIRLGQPESLPFKVAVAQATLCADDGSIARRAAYIDLSSPDNPVWLPKSAVPNGKNDDGTVSGDASH